LDIAICICKQGIFSVNTKRYNLTVLAINTRKTLALSLSILLFIVVLLSVMPTSANAVSANPAPVCSGANCTVTFSFTGDYYEWTVPTGITTVDFDVQGAQGSASTSYAGGLGGRVTGTLSVTSGTKYYFYVGGQSGYNGGGTKSNLGGGNGGGGTDIRTSANSTYLNRLVVAGGGGGAGTLGGKTSGLGGGLVGGNATGRFTASGGTQSQGGSGGSSAQAGSAGLGGNAESNGGAGGGGGGWYGGGGGGTDFPSHNDNDDDPGAGGSSYTDSLLATNVVHTQGFRSGNGVISITYLNAPTVSSFTSAQASPTNTASAITYSITFSQNVNSIAAGDFSNAGTATGCSFSPSASSGTTITISISSCGEGTLTPQVLANSVFGTVTSTNGPPSNTSASTTIIIDRTAPTISSVSGPANATYRPTQALTFSVATSETVTVTGTPRLALTIGSTTRYANYASGSNTRTLLFTYTVATSLNDIDSDGIAVSTTLDLNSGTIVDLASNAMSSLTFSAPTLASVLVAQPPAAPTIDSITASSGQISIAFTAGATNGAAIENYEYSTNNGVNWTTRSPVATTSPLTVSGLSNGTTYNVRLRAINSAGTSDSSTAVSATPTAVVVGGGSNISTTYGTAASSSQFTATGGTSPYTFTLSSTPTGVSISGGVVTASATTNAGTYTQNVVAADSGSQSGTKQIVITVGQVTPTITISLTGGATSAALGSAITITATVSQGGSVNFRLGGSSISGCSSVNSSAGSATCSWTPASLGGVVLTAVLTPTDSTNYANATTTNLNITVVNGVTTVSLSLAGGVTTVGKGQSIVITATVDQAGRISFTADGKRLPGCTNLSVSGVSKTCNWKPAVRKQVNLAARLVPTNSAYSTTSASLSVLVISRTGPRT